jgi:hypothetical protein
MSQDFHKILVKDENLMVTDDIGYAIFKGGQNVTPANFPSQSAVNTSSLSFNIQVPSEQTVISRNVLLTADISITVTGTPAVGRFLVNYGTLDAFAPFPIQSLMNTMSATINNNTTSVNIKDILAPLTKLISTRQNQIKNSGCPAYPDSYGIYPPETSLYSPSNSNYYPNTGWNNVTDEDYEPRGSFFLKSITTQSVGDGETLQSVTIVANFTEPLLLSPFLYGNPQTNNQGMYGVQNLNFVFNVGTANRVWRWGSLASQSTGANVVLNSITNANLGFRFLTPHPSDLMPSRNCIPFIDLPRYLSTFTNTVTTGNVQTFTSNTIALNQVPDKLIVFIRKPMSQQDNNDTDSFWSLQNISINWNNNSGLLSSATPQQIWQMTTEAGNPQSWIEFSGRSANAFMLPYCGGIPLTLAQGPPVTGTTGNAGGIGDPLNYGRLLPTPALSTFGEYGIGCAGSLVVLDFARHIQLVEDYYSCGSIGNFNLQITGSWRYDTYVGGQGAPQQDPTSVDPSLTATPPSVSQEMVIITVNSGIQVNEKGTTSTFTGILTKQDVLDASAQPAIGSSAMERIVGGGFLDKIRSVAMKALPMLAPVAKTLLSQVNHPLAKGASGALGALGYGRSGGQMHKLHKHLM